MPDGGSVWLHQHQGTQPRGVSPWSTVRPRVGRRWGRGRERSHSRGAPISMAGAAQNTCSSATTQCPVATRNRCPWPEGRHSAACLRGVQRCPNFPAVPRTDKSPKPRDRKFQGVHFGAQSPAPTPAATTQAAAHNKVGTLLNKFVYDSDESDSETDLLVAETKVFDLITIDSDTEGKKEVFRTYRRVMLYQLIVLGLITALSLYLGEANRRDVSGLCLRFPSIKGCEAERKGMLNDQTYVDLDREIGSLLNDSTVVRALLETNRKCSENQNILIYTCLAFLILTVVGCCSCCLKAYLEVNKCLRKRDTPDAAPASRARW